MHIAVYLLCQAYRVDGLNREELVLFALDDLDIKVFSFAASVLVTIFSSPVWLYSF